MVKKVIGLFLICFFSWFITADAKTFGPFHDQPADKSWTIRFTHEVLPETLEKNVYVSEDKEGKQLVPTTLRASGKEVYVDSPQEGYTYGKTYYLFVTDGVLSKKLKPLKNKQVVPFTIESSSLYKMRVKELRERWEVAKPRYDGPMLDVEPQVVAPYSLGKMNDHALEEALRVTNFLRYVSYLPDNVTLDPSFTVEAQAASVVNAANQQMSHHPFKPQDMDESFYELGSLGASTSNLGLGYSNVTDSILHGYMPDVSDKNRVHVGHRRWVLSPRLQKVGFGFAMATDRWKHTAMKVISDDMWRDPPVVSYEQIAWPSAVAFPIEFMKRAFPWSVSLNEEVYDDNQLDDIEVTLTRTKDGQTWKFSNETDKDGFFNISTGNYGYTPYTIIFQPNQISYQQGDTYKVNIKGIYTTTGQQTSIQYETTLFALRDGGTGSTSH
ncbi:hypothetical protein [Bacillus sp. FJAT-42315]|uniref:hypothetical protein n=1 Tax=Bacillus sp. FJAT-42315 TaxID=2014077 RepID=UPI000C23629B|nr:hypothetical protein [Bacillus sp. FJAT-42315]